MLGLTFITFFFKTKAKMVEVEESSKAQITLCLQDAGEDKWQALH